MGNIVSGNKKLPILVSVVFLLISLLYLSRLVLDIDEGIALYNAWQFWNGNTAIYTDRFVDYVSPGTGLSVFYVWRLIGRPEYFAAHLLFLVFWGLGLTGLILIIRKYSIRLVPSLLMILYWLLIFRFTSRINHNTFAASLAILVLFQVFVLIKESKISKFVLAGITTGLTFWYLQTVGLAVFMAAVISQIMTKRKGINILGYISSFLLTTLSLLSLTGLTKTIYSLLILPFKLNYLATNANQLRPHLLVVAIITLLLIFLYARRSKRPEYMVLFIFQTALYAASLNNFNRPHFLLNSVPAVIFLGLVLAEKKPAERLVFLPHLTFLVKMAVIIAGSYILYISFGNISKPKTYEYASFNVFSSPQIKNANNIYAGPYLPAVYYYAGKKTTYSLSHTDVADRRYLNRVLDEVKTVKPEIAFLNYGLVPRLVIDKNNPVDVFIRKNYLLCDNDILGTDVWVLNRKFCPE
jgi:hypothetical protein